MLIRRHGGKDQKRDVYTRNGSQVSYLDPTPCSRYHILCLQI